MRALAVLILCFLYSALSFAAASEADERYTRCETRTFSKSRKISTEHCWTADKRNGRARAFDQKEKVIYEMYLRNFGGHASVHFTYHANGAVHRADYSSAPDAGIQWYRSRHTFDENGRLVDTWTDSHDNRVTLHLDPDRTRDIPGTPEQKLPENPPQTAECQVMRSHSVWVNNPQQEAVTITGRPLKPSLPPFSELLNPGEGRRVVLYSMGETLIPVEAAYEMSLTHRSKRLYRLIRLPHNEPVPENTTEPAPVHFYFTIE